MAFMTFMFKALDLTSACRRARTDLGESFQNMEDMEGLEGWPKFGGVEQIKERCREQRSWVWLGWCGDPCTKKAAWRNGQLIAQWSFGNDGARSH